MHSTLKSVQNRAWNLKERCDDLVARKLSAHDIAILESADRDLEHLEARITGIVDKRKRKPKAAAAPADGASS